MDIFLFLPNIECENVKKKQRNKQTDKYHTIKKTLLISFLLIFKVLVSGISALLDWHVACSVELQPLADGLRGTEMLLFNDHDLKIIWIESVSQQALLEGVSDEEDFFLK